MAKNVLDYQTILKARKRAQAKKDILECCGFMLLMFAYIFICSALMFVFY